MFYVGTVKTASSSTAVQIVRYKRRKTVVVKHIGSSKNTQELLFLKKEAADWIQKVNRQPNLFKLEQEKDEIKILQLNKCQYLGVRHSFAYETINAVFNILGFKDLNKLLLDLVLVRIICPASKLHSLKLLQKLFGINYSESDIYRGMKSFIVFKQNIEGILVDFAKEKLDFNFQLILYDVTTLYFETSKDDELRKCGFSKDNKFNQPQILIGLVVNQEGFPVSFDIFEGNKFEGHTLLPSILEFKTRHKIKNLTVVADAAMISKDNIDKLKSHGLHYIVGARISSLSLKLMKKISRRLNKTDYHSIRLKNNNGYLICDFSLKRHRKDKHEMEKQIKKAKEILKHPALARKSKFLKNADKNKFKINQSLIKKAKLLLGIKGYFTNLNKPKSFIIQRYHDLWRIEKSFRMAKNDLKMRPVYHFKTEAIKSHILICFMALGVIKFMEIKTNFSTQKIVELLMGITDARILNKVNGEILTLREKITDGIKQMLKSIGLSY